MSGSLVIQSRQRSRVVDLPRLRRLTRTLLHEILRLKHFDLGVYIVDAFEITRLNETFLRHEGSTDVITFDYADEAGRASCRSNRSTRGRRSAKSSPPLHGEIIISMDDVEVNASCFGVAPRNELLRCVVHGVLHLTGFDDGTPAARRKMKREENRLLRGLAQHH